MCKAASAGIKTLLNCEFTGFETLEGGAIRAHFKDGQSINADVLMLAVGSESMELFADYDTRLSSKWHCSRLPPLRDWPRHPRAF